MPITRYYKTPEQLQAMVSQNQEVTESITSNAIFEYKTDADRLAEALPPHFESDPHNRVRLTLSKVDVQLGELNFAFGSVAIVLPCALDGEAGSYCLHMYMDQETPVVAGREIYGEPKKIAEVVFDQDGNSLHSKVSRHFMPFIQFDGQVSDVALPCSKTEQTMFVYKAFPALDGTGFEYPPRLNRLRIHTNQSTRHRLEGELQLLESPLDPIADLPIREMLSMEFETGTSYSNGEFIREVSAADIAGHFHNRNDDLQALLG